jgi:hypothetical protein
VARRTTWMTLVQVAGMAFGDEVVRQAVLDQGGQIRPEASSSVWVTANARTDQEPCDTSVRP